MQQQQSFLFLDNESTHFLRIQDDVYTHIQAVIWTTEYNWPVQQYLVVSAVAMATQASRCRQPWWHIFRYVYIENNRGGSSNCSLSESTLKLQLMILYVSHPNLIKNVTLILNSLCNLYNPWLFSYRQSERYFADILCRYSVFFKCDYFSARFSVQCFARILFLAGWKTSEIAIRAPRDIKLSN